VDASDSPWRATLGSASTARIWDLSTLPKSNVFEVACAWLPDHSPEGLAQEYGLKIDQPICEPGKHLPSAQLPMKE
jgi:hypothetical protein